MSALNTLSSNQKLQLRNAFTLIDGESRDSVITKQDLINIYQTVGLKVPTDEQLFSMLELGGKKLDEKTNGINFSQFSNIMANELSKFDDRMTIYHALKVFGENKDKDEGSDSDIIIDADRLKDACCSVQLGEIGSGDNRLARATFDKLVNGFVKEQTDGKKLFLASKWIDAYID